MTRRSVEPFHTPPEVPDGRQPRETAVRCVVHSWMPTWRRDALCHLCTGATT